MGLDLVSIKITWSNIRIIEIALLCLFLLSGSAGAAFSSTASYRTYAPGDLILSHEDGPQLWEKDVPMVSRECGENRTFLKEGYLFLFDNVNQIYIPSADGTVKSKRSANFSLYKNGEIVKQLNVNEGNFFYYNKTIDGNEYTIIKFKVVSIFSADGLCGGYWAQIQQLFQYSDGTGGQEIYIGNSGLSPLPEGIEHISVASQTETGNTMHNITGISNKTEKMPVSPIQTLMAVPNESTIIPSEKTAGFEVFLAITALLLVIRIRAK